jgi:hypothetical protein
VGEKLRLHRGFDVRKRGATRIQRHVLEEEGDPVEWLDEAELLIRRYSFARTSSIAGEVSEW